MKRPVLFLLVLILTFPLFAEDPYLSIELTEYLYYPGAIYLKSDDDSLFYPDRQEQKERRQVLAVETLKEEALWIFSVMVYGFRFHYVPGSGSLEVEDSFELEPLFLIPEEDDRLKQEQLREEPNRIAVQFSYWPDDFQKRRISRYKGSGFQGAGGSGSAGITLEGARISAMKNAVKQALREDLRKRYFNRPRSVHGFASFSHSPKILPASGSYNASVRILYRIEKLEFYPAR